METGPITLPPWIYFWLSAFLSAVISVFITRFMARRIAKWMPRTISTAVQVSSLVGRFGVASVPIDESGGRARVKDKFGDFHNIYCRTQKGDPEIGMNEEVFVLQKLDDDDLFIVIKKQEVA
jgi:membrane protein implicated in regulation of membrane protease activity